MELKQLTEDKEEKIGESIIVRAYGVGLEGRGNEMTSISRLRKAIEEEAPHNARNYRILEEINVGKNILTDFSEFKVQYYL